MGNLVSRFHWTLGQRHLFLRQTLLSRTYLRMIHPELQMKGTTFLRQIEIFTRKGMWTHFATHPLCTSILDFMMVRMQLAMLTMPQLTVSPVPLSARTDRPLRETTVTMMLLHWRHRFGNP